MTTQRSSRIRSQAWEDLAPEETPSRRGQQSAPPAEPVRRGAAAAPADSRDPEPTLRFGSAPPPERPSSGWTRALLSLAAVLLLCGLSVSALLLKAYLSRDNRFRIAGAGNIQATGLTEVSRAELLPVFGEDIGRNVFFIPLSERRRQLEQIPWIEHATVMRLLPDQIRVHIVERQPVAFVRQGQQIGLVDANGVLLSMPAALMAQHHYSFPVLTGIDPHDSPEAARNRMAVYERLIGELDANGQHLSEQISEIDLTDPEDARILMPEQGGDILAHFGEDHFLDRYQRYRAHIAEWRQQYPNLAAVDLRYDRQVVLQMTQGADATQPTAATVAADGSQGKPSAAAPAPTGQGAAATDPVRPGKKNAGGKTAAARNRDAQKKKKQASAERTAYNLNAPRKPHPAQAGRSGSVSPTR